MMNVTCDKIMSCNYLVIHLIILKLLPFKALIQCGKTQNTIILWKLYTAYYLPVSLNFFSFFLVFREMTGDEWTTP